MTVPGDAGRAGRRGERCAAGDLQGQVAVGGGLADEPRQRERDHDREHRHREQQPEQRQRAARQHRLLDERGVGQRALALVGVELPGSASRVEERRRRASRLQVAPTACRTGRRAEERPLRGLARMSTTACSPGRQHERSGSNANRTLPSGSSPAEVARSSVLPVFSTSRLNAADLAGGDRHRVDPHLHHGASGTTSSTSSTCVASGGVSSRTCTAIRRLPAGHAVAAR